MADPDLIMMKLAQLEAQRHSKPQPVEDVSVLHDANALVWDTETVPAVAHVYQLKQSGFIPHSSVIYPGGLLGFSYSWLHEDEVHWVDIRDGYRSMLDQLWDVLDMASYQITWNGDKFDIPKARGWFARAGMPPARPAKSIDLMKTARTLGFESSSLDYACRMLGVTRKVDNGGAALWKRCLEGDEEAWDGMAEYGKGDIVSTKGFYWASLPYIRNAPTMAFAAYKDGMLCCPRCGVANVKRDGVYLANALRFKQYRCNNCTGVFYGERESRVVYTKAVQ